jgi:ParB-like chromosome segregation protein Spo0J
MGKLHQTMRGMVCSKEVDGIGESTEYRGDPRLLVIDWSKNSRPMNREHVDEFKQVIRSGAYIPRIIIKVIDSKIHVIDGFHRSTAYLECIAEGVEIESVELAEFKGSDADEVVLKCNSAGGLHNTLLQLGVQYAQLEAFGWSIEKISQKIGKKSPHIIQCLELARAPSEIQSMVERQEVSATQALATIKKHGSKAKTVLADGFDAATKAGKKRVTKKTVENLAVPPMEPGQVQQVDLVSAIQLEIKSHGIFRAEASCVKHADLIAWLRGTAKDEAVSLEMKAA